MTKVFRDRRSLPCHPGHAKPCDGKRARIDLLEPTRPASASRASHACEELFVRPDRSCWRGSEVTAACTPPTITDKTVDAERRCRTAHGGAPAVVTELDGKHVRIGGYVVPLDFEATSVKEFLFVPFVGACIHVPPPPPNQIIYVKTAKGFDVAGSFDPVYVTGTLKVAFQYTGLAETGYTIDAEKVEMRKE